MTAKHRYILIFLFVLPTIGLAQENTFALSSRVLGANNPSFFGFNNDSEVSMLHKMQSINDVKSQASFLSVSKFFPNNNFSLAASVFRENFGIASYSKSKVNLSFIYQVAINENWKAYPSISAGIVNNLYDYSSLIFDNQLDLYSNILKPLTGEDLEANEMVRYYPDYSTGIMVNNKSFFFGLAISHINKPKQFIGQDLKLDVGMSTQIGYELNINNSSLFLYSSFSKVGTQQRYLFSQDFTLSAFTVGLFETISKSGNAKGSSKTLGGMFRVQLSKFELTSSYSYGLDKILSSNSIEVGLIYNFNPDKLESEGYNKRFYLD